MAKIYDVCIIGSGAAGGMTAHVLTQAGLDVVMLEAGPRRDPAELPVHRVRRWNLPKRGLRGDYFQEYLEQTNFLIDDRKEPYGWAGDDYFQFVRVRAVGGKSLFWAGVTPRLGVEEFQPLDDHDTRWPITYEEIAPWYDKVEALIGVSSSGKPPGAFPLNNGLPSLKPKAAELEFAKVAGKLGKGLEMIPIPKAILTKDHNGRPACHYCGPCWVGCDSGSKFDSLRVFLNGAERTGKLTLLAGARVRSIELDKEGRASKAHYYDVANKTWKEIRARQFVMAAGCVESAHILLNSKIANSSGLVGRYLSEHMYAAVSGHLPQLMGRPVTNEDGNGAHSFIPDLTKNWRGKKFLRGYQIFPGGGTGETTFVGKSLPGFGQPWKKSIRDYYTAGASVLFQGEVLPYRDNRIEVDETLRDDAGIPGIRFHFRYRENEQAMFADMMETGEELLKAAGAEYFAPKNPKWMPYGHSIHYVGTARMGKDPTSSVTDPYGQSHDVPNLFVHDAGIFVTAGNQNPTLTILALALRGSERIVERWKRREV